MANKDVVFPVGYREGATIMTKHGPVTVGRHRKASLTPEQHADLLAARGDDYFDHSDQDPTAGELEAERITAAETARLARAAAPSAAGVNPEYERYASAQEAASRAAVRTANRAPQHLAEKALASANASETGEAQIELGDGTVAGGRSAALTRQGKRAAAQAEWDAAPAEGTTTDAGPQIPDPAPPK